jgi:hypothetical protein
MTKGATARVAPTADYLLQNFVLLQAWTLAFSPTKAGAFAEPGL